MDKKLGLQSVLETVDYVRKAWGNIGLPSNLAPTMNVEELDKRITDMKAVEQWLEVNQSLLRATIQGLEVQRNTIAAVQAFGQAVKSGAKPIKSGAKSAINASPGEAMSAEFAKAFSAPSLATTNLAASDASSAASAWWDMLQSQFNQIAQTALAGDNPLSSQGGQLQRAAKSVATKVAKTVVKSVAKTVANQMANQMANQVANRRNRTAAKKVTSKAANIAPSKGVSKLRKKTARVSS